MVEEPMEGNPCNLHPPRPQGTPPEEKTMAEEDKKEPEKAPAPVKVIAVLVRLAYGRPQEVCHGFVAQVDDGTLAIELEDGGWRFYAPGQWHTVETFLVVEGDDPCPRCRAVKQWDNDITARQCSKCGESQDMEEEPAFGESGDARCAATNGPLGHRCRLLTLHPPGPTDAPNPGSHEWGVEGPEFFDPMQNRWLPHEKV